MLSIVELNSGLAGFSGPVTLDPNIRTLLDLRSGLYQILNTYIGRQATSDSINHIRRIVMDSLKEYCDAQNVIVYYDDLSLDLRLNIVLIDVSLRLSKQLEQLPSWIHFREERMTKFCESGKTYIKRLGHNIKIWEKRSAHTKYDMYGSCLTHTKHDMYGSCLNCAATIHINEWAQGVEVLHESSAIDTYLLYTIASANESTILTVDVPQSYYCKRFQAMI